MEDVANKIRSIQIRGKHWYRACDLGDLFGINKSSLGVFCRTWAKAKDCKVITRSSRGFDQLFYDDKGGWRLTVLTEDGLKAIVNKLKQQQAPKDKQPHRNRLASLMIPEGVQ